MKLLAYGLLALTVLLAVDAINDEFSGRAVVIGPGRSFQRSVAIRDKEPENFRNLMTFQWIRAILPATGGFFLLYLIRRSDQLDPFSPHFKGMQAIDELANHLDENNKR